MNFFLFKNHAVIRKYVVFYQISYFYQQLQQTQLQMDPSGVICIPGDAPTGSVFAVDVPHNVSPNQLTQTSTVQSSAQFMQKLFPSSTFNSCTINVNFKQ